MADFPGTVIPGRTGFSREDAGVTTAHGAVNHLAPSRLKPVLRNARDPTARRLSHQMTRLSHSMPILLPSLHSKRSTL